MLHQECKIVSMKLLSAILIILFSASVRLTFQEKKLLSDDANKFMWDNLHLGNYDSISLIIQKLNSALEKAPDDSTLNTHLGFIYLWKFCERNRDEPDTTIFQNIYKSSYFFRKAIGLNPNDSRLYSLEAATEMCAGEIQKNNRQRIKGYWKAMQAVPKWPQFNRFSLGAIEALLNKNSFRFRQGLRYQWITMDECSCKKLTKKEILEHPEKVIPELIDEISNSPNQKIKRACWNTWIAPHNFEGYLLNFGDMLVKKGMLTEALKIYSAIKLSPSYNDWPYSSVLDDRINNIKTNEIQFNKPLQLIIPRNASQIFINSGISCVGCHQMSQHEFETMQKKN
jgi:hypothetical protein